MVKTYTINFINQDVDKTQNGRRIEDVLLDILQENEHEDRVALIVNGCRLVETFAVGPRKVVFHTITVEKAARALLDMMKTGSVPVCNCPVHKCHCQAPA